MAISREEQRANEYDRILQGWKRQVGDSMLDVFEGGENKYVNNSLGGFAINSGRIATIDWESYSLLIHGVNSLLRIMTMQNRVVTGVLYIPVKYIYMAHDGDFDEKEPTSSGSMFGYRGVWDGDAVNLCELDKNGYSKGITMTREEIDYLFEKFSIMKDYKPVVDTKGE